MYTICEALSLFPTSIVSSNLSENDAKRPLCVKIDSRTVEKGDVFVALRGVHCDGHSFCRDAFDRGASCVLVSNTEFLDPSDQHICVKDTRQFLIALAKAFRQRYSGLIIGITGSNGKTGTKEMLLHTLSRKHCVGGTKKNQNNALGVCLTLLSLKSSHNIFIVEMGISRMGEMDVLVDMVRPDGAIVTNIHFAHLEGFKSLEIIAQEKLKILKYMTKKNFFVYHKEHKILREKSHFFSGKRWEISEKDSSPSLLKKDWGPSQKNVPLVLCVASHLGFDDKEIAESLANFSGVPGRFKLYLKKTICFVDDSYNANPSSFLEGLRSFLHLSRGNRRCLCVADMEDLNSFAPLWHSRVLKEILSSGAFQILLVGPCFRRAYENNKDSVTEAQNIVLVDTVFEAMEQCRPSLEKGDYVYLKGSRKHRLDLLLKCFEEHIEELLC